MKIVIIGAGDVGSYLAAKLSEQHAVTLIESQGSIARQADEQYDIKVLNGNGSSAEVLTRAGVKECNYFLAMTSDDKTNIIASSLAKALGAGSTIARIHDQTYRDNSYLNYAFHFGIDFMLNPEALCAVELAKAIRNPDRVAVENLARGQIEVQQVLVSDRSKLTGKKLSDLKLDPSLRIGYVLREDNLEMASADTILQGGDEVTVIGTPDALFEIKPQLNPESKIDTVRIALWGGDETAIALARLLSNPRFKVRIIDSDHTRCRELAEKFPKVTVIHGDVTSLRLMEEEQIGSCDYFIACTKKDEDNIMAGLQATQLGAQHIQLVINRVDYEEIIGKLKWLMGVELAVSPRVATVREVLRYISIEPFIELATLPNQVGKILEIQVTCDGEYSDKPFKDIPWPRDCIVAALLHKYGAKVPSGEDKLLPGDRVVVITKDDKDNIAKLLSLLTGE